MDRYNWAAIGFGLTLAGVLITVMSVNIKVMLREGAIQDACIVAGYPDSYVIHGEGYCKKKVNGTDVITPLKDLR